MTFPPGSFFLLITKEFAMQRRRFLASTLSSLALAALPWNHSTLPAWAAIQSGDPSATPTLSFAPAEKAKLAPAKLEKAFAFVASRVSSGRIPGAVLLVARNGRIAGWKAYGQIDRRGGSMRRDAIFDLESISKVVATAPSIMILIERGILHLDDPVAHYLPDFAAHGKGAITIREMLRYTSGLDVDAAFQDTSTPRATPAQVAQAWQIQLTQPTVYATNSQVLYSDLTYRTLAASLKR